MSDVEEELGNEEEQQLSEVSASRRSSFVERKRQIQRENSEEDEVVGNQDQTIEGTREADVSGNQETDNDDLDERTSAAAPISESAADADTENDTALYDEVDQDWAEPAEPQPPPTVPSRDVDAEWAAETTEIVEEIVQPAADFPAPVEVEEIIDEVAPVESDLREDNKNEFELTEVTDDVQQVTSARDKQKSSLGSPEGGASAEKGRQRTVLEERAAVKLQQVEAAEELAMAAEQAKVARKEALRLREAKRHEEFVSGLSKEPTGELGEGLEDNNAATSKHKQFLPHIPKRVRAGAGKGRAGQESDVEGSVAGDDLSSNGHHHDAAEDLAKAQRALRSKSLVSRVRRNKVATAAGDDSVDDSSDKKSPPQHQQLDGVGIEGNSLSRNPSQGPKPPRRKVGGVVGRPGRRIASSTTDDTEPRDGDREGTHFPPLVHPRSSPDPSQYGDAEGMSSAENGENSQKGRKHRKPLFLRMIERAQQQTLEDEKQKHEQYVEQKKIRQKNNPSAEELRAHRHKHDELMRAKQDEARRAMADAAAANAKAVPVKKAVVAAVEAPATSDVLRDPSVEAAASLPKKKKKKVAAISSVAASRNEVNGEADLSTQAPAEKQEKHGLHINGSSPAKKARGAADSKEGNGSASKHTHHSPATSSEAPLQPSPVRKLNFDAAAASKAVALQPELSVEGSVAAFCSPDWLAAFARLDLDEVNNDRETGPEPPSDSSAFLQPAPPTIDAYKLMYGNSC